VRGYVRDPAELPAMMTACAAMPGVAAVLGRAEAAARFEMPHDREADFVVVGARDTALGAARAGHDLSGLAGHTLRSHGGEGERRVPFALSRALTPEYRGRAEAGGLHNYDIFDFALNGVM
jgi:phosphonoacetate hydrolase